MSTVKLFAECFCSREIHNHYAVTPSAPLLERWMDEHPRATRLFARIYHPGRDEEETFLAPIGDPVHDDEHRNALYLPTWMIDSNKYEGCGEEAVVLVVEANELPRATKIVLRPVDSTLHEVDVVQVFERSFSNLGVLSEGKLYLIPLEELGGFQVAVYVSHLEPGPEVFLDGDEVPLEFEQPVDYVEPARRPSTPIPEGPPLLAAEPSDLMIPSNAMAASGNADYQQAYQAPPPGPRNNLRNRGTHPPGFIPFSGQGHRLDGK